ncbi:MAG: DinB family protein [Phycisphaerales bacterium]|nr:DinB family protein [Phycisphaerales bacterium]MCB9862682.1 DinB family protein [Phycisphaerales bacterium]
MKISHIRELFDNNQWANGHLYEVAAVLSDDDLDRLFDIGPGTLRKILQHLYGAEAIWYERIGGTGYDEPRAWDAIDSVADLQAASEALHTARDAWLNTLSDADLAKTFTYTLRSGESCTSGLADILVHVCDHGIHHRAQASNMTRHIGEPFRHSDYLRFRLARPTVCAPSHETADFLRNADVIVGEDVEAPRPLSLTMLRRQFAYTDWANDLLMDAAKALGDDKLDQAFEMGIGTFRKTMLHIESAERYWLGHWRGESHPTWQELDETTTIAGLADAWKGIRKEREACFDTLDDAALMREVTAEPGKGMHLTFRLGETILQVATHGTHHRAQALNMLRHLADISIQMSFIVFTRLN